MCLSPAPAFDAVLNLRHACPSLPQRGRRGAGQDKGGEHWCGQEHQGHSGHNKLSLLSDHISKFICKVAHLHMHAQVQTDGLSLFLLVGNLGSHGVLKDLVKHSALCSLDCTPTVPTLESNWTAGNNTYCTTELHKVTGGVPEPTRLIPLSK